MGFAGTRSRFVKAVKLVNREDAEARIETAGALTGQFARSDPVGLDLLGYWPLRPPLRPFRASITAITTSHTAKKAFLRADTVVSFQWRLTL